MMEVVEMQIKKFDWTKPKTQGTSEAQIVGRDLGCSKTLQDRADFFQPIAFLHYIHHV